MWKRERKGKLYQGHKGRARATGYFRDKFIISLQIQYGCRLENVVKWEGGNNTEINFIFTASILTA